MSDPKSYFQDAAVRYKGRLYQFSVQEGQALLGRGGQYWHGPSNPSTWLAVAVFKIARRKLKEAPQHLAMELTAQSMGITIEKLVDLIEWHEEYMRWHDGDESYRVLEK